MISETHNIDCMEYLKTCADKQFDLAVVDPPYGSAGTSKFAEGQRFGMWFDKYKRVDRSGGARRSKYGKKIIDWDVAPQKKIFCRVIPCFKKSNYIRR